MRVKVDETGQHRVAGPVDRRGAVSVAPRYDRGDLPVDNVDTLIREDLGGGGIDDPARVNVDGLGDGWGRNERSARNQRL
jgi:hypothetical protein